MTTTYEATIRSTRWKRLKWRRALIAGFRCEGCGRKARSRTVRSSLRKFHLHHRHYETVGSESVNDVMVLCPICHALEHDKIPEALA